MTYTIMGVDRKNSRIGIAIATYSLAVGSTCPQLVENKYAITSQASTNPLIGEKIAKIIKTKDPESAINEILNKDKFQEYRQIAVLSLNGDKYTHTGSKTKYSKGSIKSKNSIAIGNFLYNEKVLINMMKSFEENSEYELGERLIKSLIAGKKSGGQSGSDGQHLPERSACLMIGSKDEIFPIDIRVDFSDKPIEELSKAFKEYKKMHDYYLARALEPSKIPSQDDWVKKLKSINKDK